MPPVLSHSLLKIIPAIMKVLIPLLASLLLTSCNYFAFRYEPASERLGKLDTARRYFIVHQYGVGYALTDMRLDVERGTITGNLRELPVEHMAYQRPGLREEAPNRFWVSGKKKTPDVIREVHIYLRTPLFSPAADMNRSITIPFTEIEKVAVYKRDDVATFLSVVGIAGLVLLEVILLAVLTSGFSFGGI